jgi:hypothetical protein
MMLEVAFAFAIAAAQDQASLATTRELERIEQRLAETWKATDCTG